MCIEVALEREGQGRSKASFRMLKLFLPNKRYEHTRVCRPRTATRVPITPELSATGPASSAIRDTCSTTDHIRAGTRSQKGFGQTTAPCGCSRDRTMGIGLKLP